MVKNLNCNKKKIIIDFDDTIYKSVFIGKMNDFMGTNLTVEDFDSYYMDHTIPEDKQEAFYDFLVKDDIYAGYNFFDDAVEVIKKLNDKYDVYICSGCVIYNSHKNSGWIFYYKYNCLLKYLPFIHPDRFIFTQSKDLVKADIIIDDNPIYLKEERETKILFDSYHNRNLTNEELKKDNIIRAKNWKEIENILLK